MRVRVRVLTFSPNQQAAVRAAHHIGHLLRAERAAACEVLRNT